MDLRCRMVPVPWSFNSWRHHNINAIDVLSNFLILSDTLLFRNFFRFIATLRGIWIQLVYF